MDLLESQLQNNPPFTPENLHDDEEATMNRPENNASRNPGQELARVHGGENEPEEIAGTYDLGCRDVRVQVAWDGRSRTTGRMSVRGREGRWKRLKHIQVQPRINDVLSLGKRADGSGEETFTVTVERGGEHPRSQFWIEARPIRWTQQGLDALGGDERDAFVARFQDDYGYCAEDDQSASDSYQRFSTLVDEVQCASIQLPVGGSYELWVTLQNPHDRNDSLVLDPIIDDGPGGGGGGTTNQR